MVTLRIDCPAADVLSALREIGICGARETDGYTEVRVKRKELQKAIAICGERCYNYKITDISSRSAARRLLAKLPLALSVVALAAMMFASNAFVWKVEITGLDGSARLLAERVLAEEGARAGAVKSSIDLRETERALTALGCISAASVTVRGNTLSADCLASDGGAAIRPGGENLISGYDCVVTRVVAESGTPVVSAGDVVVKGDVLIEGREYRTADGTDAGAVAARGRAYGRVTFAYPCPLGGGGLRRTGESMTTTGVGLAGAELAGEDCPYEFYESETERTRLYPLPVEIVRTTYYELEEESFDGEAERFAEEKEEELRALYGAGFERRASVTESGGAKTVTIYFTAEICIGEV